MSQNTHNLTRMMGGSRQIAPAYLPWYFPRGATSGGNDLFLDPWMSLEERLLLGLASSQRLPPPLQILFLDDEIARELNPRRRDPFPAPAFAGAWYQQQQQEQFPAPAFAGGWYQEPARLTQEEQKAALKKLKKDVYNPMPKIITRRLSMFYQDGGRYNVNDKREEKHEEEERKRCAICLEDFESREQVLITPCDHMFHEDCIVPWVKSHAQCPVCRFALCDRLNPH